MKKKVLIFILFSLCILFISCQQKGEILKSYRTGTEGLSMKIVEGLPPNIVFENTNIPVVLKISNRGAEDVNYTDIMLRLMFDTTYIGGEEDIELPKEDKLEYEVFSGKNIKTPEGSEKLITTSPLHIKKIIGTREAPTTEISASICYKYRTYMAEQICIDNNRFFESKRSQPCSAKDISPKPQGAPVAVTKVETTPTVVNLGSKQIIVPEFIVYIENVGKGEIMAPSTKDIENACLLKGLKEEEISGVEVEAKLMNRELKCEPRVVSVKRHLTEKKSYTKCRVNEEDFDNSLFSTPQNYLTILSVELGYYYKEMDKRNIEIQRTNILEGEETSKEEDALYYIEGEVACEYYAAHGGLGNINENYSCQCNYEECMQLSRVGKCYFGLCPGGYCCDIMAKKR